MTKEQSKKVLKTSYIILSVWWIKQPLNLSSFFRDTMGKNISGERLRDKKRCTIAKKLRLFSSQPKFFCLIISKVHHFRGFIYFPIKQRSQNKRRENAKLSDSQNPDSFFLNVWHKIDRKKFVLFWNVSFSSPSEFSPMRIFLSGILNIKPEVS